MSLGTTHGTLNSRKQISTVDGSFERVLKCQKFLSSQSLGTLQELKMEYCIVGSKPLVLSISHSSVCHDFRLGLKRSVPHHTLRPKTYRINPC